MTLRSRLRAAALFAPFLCVVWLHAQPASDRLITVRFYNLFGFAREDVHAAQTLASAILQSAGVEWRWRECHSGSDPSRASFDACADPLTGAEVIVRVSPGPQETGTAAQVLGYSLVHVPTRTGTLATVFGDRVSALASRLRVNRATLLGRAMAHELAHLLLGTPEHLPDGLMRAHWPDEMITRGTDRAWHLSAAATATIGAAVHARGALPTDVLAVRGVPSR